MMLHDFSLPISIAEADQTSGMNEPRRNLEFQICEWPSASD